MSKRVLIMDTSVLCCWLQVPGKEEAGPADDRWNHKRIAELLATEEEKNSTFVLPMASLIETGNHIAQAAAYRYERATELAGHLTNAANASSPWAAFVDQSPLWESTNLHKLAQEWPPLAAQGITIGDATIKDVAEHYARAGYAVEILTGDQGLKAFEPLQPAAIPRRRR